MSTEREPLPSNLSRGWRIRWLMERKGIRPQALSDQLAAAHPHLRISYKKLHKLMYDREHAVLEAELLYALAEALDSSPEWILWGISDTGVYPKGKSRLQQMTHDASSVRLIPSARQNARSTPTRRTDSGRAGESLGRPA